MAPLTLSQLLTGYGAELLVSDYQLPGIYTLQAWNNYVQPAITQLVKSASEGDWVIDTPLTELNRLELPHHKQTAVTQKAAAALTEQLETLYLPTMRKHGCSYYRRFKWQNLPH